ncbi:hypothetical protein [Kitasatospora sp. NPDC001175]|uniref:hypothetical protein n=1 Tax=Kitasatospora sp. NPDC001175 TaxID=3157103 RepID=UPI003D05793E
MHHNLREALAAVIQHFENVTGLAKGELLASDDTSYFDLIAALHTFTQSIRHILDTLQADRRPETLAFLRLELQYAEQTAREATETWLDALFADNSSGPDGTPT